MNAEINMNMVVYYTKVRDYIVNSEYEPEMTWCENIPQLNDISAETFFQEYVFVVLNAGMKEQVARKIYEKFFTTLDFNTIGHLGKRSAIELAARNYETWFRELRCSTDKLEYLKSLPWIGDITKYHLARNIGIETVKPDRHLVRLSKRFGYTSPIEMCLDIQKISGERLGVIDVILWRWCNLFGSDSNPGEVQ